MTLIEGMCQKGLDKQFPANRRIDIFAMHAFFLFAILVALGITKSTHLKKKLPVFVALLLRVLITSGQPTITSVAPIAGPIGTSVSISGTNFNPVPANNIVFFGGVRANVTAATTTSLTVTIPTGASMSC